MRARLVAVFFLLAGSLGFAFGTQMLVSGIAGLQADLFIKDWQQRRELPSERAHEVARDAAQRASTWFPVPHGRLAEREGLIGSWLTYNRPFGDPRYDADRRAALSAYQASLQARPGWPSAWVGVARLKLELGETDVAFQEALQNALVYGAVRWEIQRDVARIGLLAWPTLPMADQSRVLEAASRTAARNRYAASDLALYLDHADVRPAFCRYQRALNRPSHRICR